MCLIAGVKWSMPKWIHVGRYATAGEVPETVEQTVQVVPKHPGECEDENDSCDAWAVTGECDKNPGYMVGTVERPGACLKACGRCDMLKAFKAKQHPEGTAEQRKLSRRLR
jgi:prolyl 4-hydroxylase